MDKNAKDVGFSDDEEDLEHLRLAALQTLKTIPSSAKENVAQGNLHKDFSGSNFSKRRRGFHNNRPPKNGQFRNKVRTSNLISIPVLDSDNLPEKPTKNNDSSLAPKLILPQDRYCNQQTSQKSIADKVSKFDRYDKSDSESDFEETASKSSGASPARLERTNSLEALIQELDNEILGNTEDTKLKTNKITKNETETEEKEIETKIENNKVEDHVIKEEKVTSTDVVEPIENPSKLPPKPLKNRPALMKKHPRYRRRSLSPVFTPQVFPAYVPPPSYPSVPFTNPYVPYNPLPSVIPPVVSNFPPAYIPSPIPPFSAAPLSPRSAQFVLQNQKIIEKRKLSPRRSYSRSLSPESPRSDRSLSPRPKNSRRNSLDRRSPLRSRMYSPINSPERTKPSRYLSPVRGSKIGPRSPNRKVKNSPKRSSANGRQTPTSNRLSTTSSKALSPVDSRRGNHSPKNSVYERLGAKKGIKRSRSPSQDKQLPSESTDQETKKTEKTETMDPILEARKRKFESNEIAKEGIIRLSTKNKEHEEKIEDREEQDTLSEENDEDVLEDLLLNPKIDDIFPEEESDEENEGRFKSSSSKSTRNVSVLPFTKLLNGSSSSIAKISPDSRKRTLKNDLTSRERRRDRSKRNAEKSEKSRSPLHDKNESSETRSPKTSSASKSVLKGRIVLKDSKSERKVPVSALLENKKIEIKIRNPSKYEGDVINYDVLNKDQLKEKDKKELKRIDRKVTEVIKEKRKVKEECIEVEEELSDTEPEIIIDYDLDEEDDGKDILNKTNAGDLRAQLSRKRADRERQKIPLESVQSRLLQNALEGAVYKKDKKSKSKKRSKESAPKEGKLPIHMRLGVPKGETKLKRKRSKKNSSLDQV